jgi:hypothetical protein
MTPSGLVGGINTNGHVDGGSVIRLFVGIGWIQDLNFILRVGIVALCA